MYDLRYNIIGSKFQTRKNYNRYMIQTTKQPIYIWACQDLISLVDLLTKTKYRFIFDEDGFETVIFRKHIVKIIRIKEDLI